MPDIKWLKDGLPVAKHVTVSNSDTSSQLMIPSAERNDTGIYTIIVKNLVGQETSSVEIRVTGTGYIVHTFTLLPKLLTFSDEAIKAVMFA